MWILISQTYEKIRNSKKWHCDFNQQCINILLAGQLENDEEQILNNVRGRGGLWLIKGFCQNIFQISETMKDKQDKILTNKIESHDLAENILKDSGVYSNFMIMQNVVLTKKCP